MTFQAVKVPSLDLETGALPYSSATKANGFIFVSGQVSKENGRIVNDAFEDQFARTMKCVEEVLAAAGASLKDVCQVRGYVHDPKDTPLYNKLYREYFKEPYPARTTLNSCLNENVAFEMDVVAVDPNWGK